jgi:hypothetical protein
MKQTKIFIAAGIALLILFLSGCATAPGSAHFLRSDAHSGDAYKAVIFGRAKIQATFPFHEDRLFMALLRINTKPDPSNINLISNPFNKPSKNFSQIEVPFAIEVIPGAYDLRSIGLSSGYLPERIRLTPKGEFVDGDPKKGHHKIQHQITVGENEMMYVGTIVIDILEKTGSSAAGYNYKYTFNFENHIQKDADLLKAAYPAVFRQYKENIKSPFR